jgi:hypothetical protein
MMMSCVSGFRMGHVNARNVVKQKLGELDWSALGLSTVNKPQTDGTTLIRGHAV